MKEAAKKNIKLCIFYFFISLLALSCSNNEKEKIAPAKLQSLYAAPDTVLLDTTAPPKKVELKNAPPPLIIPVPTSPGGFYSINSGGKKEKIELKPPVVTKASMAIADFTNFNTEQGLASSSISCGMLDKKGQLWFSTGNYVCRYDGAGFSTFSVGQGSGVMCIIEDKNGNIWFATWGGGVYRYDGVRFTHFTTREGLANDMVTKVMQDKKGNLWFTTYGGGVSRFDGTSFKSFNTGDGLASNEVNAIAEDKNGNIWFGTLMGGVSRYDGKNFTTFTKQNGLAHNTVFSILQDKSGILWFGTQEGITRFDGTNFTTINTDGLLSNNVNAIAEDKTGNLWFATIGGGVCHYDGTGFTIFTTEQGLANNSVSSITEDKNGYLWFGTGGGLSRYNGKSFNAFTTKQGIPSASVLSIAEDKTGDLWFGTYGSGMSRYDGKNFTTFTTHQGLPDNQINYILQDKSGNLWISTALGTSRYDGKSFTTFTASQGMVYGAVNKFFEDKNGNIWMTTQEGVSRFDGSGFTSFTTAQGLANNNVSGIAEGPDADLWFATEGSGVSRYNGKSFINYTVKQGLAHNVVRSIIKDHSGNLWFGTLGGISRFDGSGFISFNSNQGLADNVIADIVEDEQGVIWFGTDKGFCGLKFKTSVQGNKPGKPGETIGAGFIKENNEILENYEPVWETYNNKTGYPVKDLVQGAMCITKWGLPFGNKEDAGVIWGGCIDEKAIRFDPRSVITFSEKPAPYFQSIKINETSLNWYSLGHIKKDSAVIAQQEAMVYGKLLAADIRDSLQKKFGDIQFDSISPFYQLPHDLVLPYSHNRVTIDFGAIETDRNFMVRYQYMLDGYDKEWSPVTEISSATYGNISEGTHTFKLKARSPEGIWSDPISYSFKVLPPWWRTWWFRTMIGILSLVLLYSIYRWRTSALRQQKRKLEKTVKERTAEVVKQKEKSDELLLNILPSEVADELKEKGYTTAKSFDDVTVLFSDIKGFTSIAEKMTAQELVKEINNYFSAFDRTMQQYGLEKIKTIGDAYIAAGGLLEKNNDAASQVVKAAIAMQQMVEKFKQERIAAGKPYFEMRIGIHTGPVVAGVVGIKKFQYDIWGDTVNLAARMEQSGVPGKINISQHTYELVKGQFTCIHRGKIEAKNKGEIDMYFVE